MTYAEVAIFRRLGHGRRSLCIFTAPTSEDVEEANRRAGTDYERIIQTLTIERAAATDYQTH